MLNSQFLDRGPVFPILQKSNMEVVQASLNSSLRVWQILLGSVAECWLTAQIMNQRQHRQPFHPSQGGCCVYVPVDALHLPRAAVLQPLGWQHLPSLPLELSVGLLLKEVGPSAQECVLSHSKAHPGSCKALPRICHKGLQLFLLVLQKRQGRVLLTFQIPSAD